MSEKKGSSLRIGWASRDVTPERPVLLRGQFYARVSEGIKDPITVTALALESARDGGSPGQAVLVSCDYVAISDALESAVRERLRESLPGLDSRNVFLNATHTHTGPDTRLAASEQARILPDCPGLSEEDLGVMGRSEYLSFAAAQIADAVTEAWRTRAPGGIGFGVGHAVVGLNRRMSYFNGETRMYGKTDDPEFSHVEGGEDHAVNVLCTWDAKRNLTGLAVNVACPAQVTEELYEISADYWHETRVELRRRLGDHLFVLPQCSAAGDQSPHVLVGEAAEERMWKLAGRTQRQDIGVRIADAVTAILPFLEKDIDWTPAFAHRVDAVELPVRRLSEEDVSEARAEAEKYRLRYEALRKDLEAHPEKRRTPRWYRDITAAYSGMLWNRRVEKHFISRKTQPIRAVQVHVVRLGDVAFVTNPFEYYLDFGMQIKARSKAVQTFVVQLAAGDVGGYLPTARSTAGHGYGSVPASTMLGPEGGRLLAQRTVEIIAELMEASRKRSSASVE